MKKQCTVQTFLAEVFIRNPPVFSIHSMYTMTANDQSTDIQNGTVKIISNYPMINCSQTFCHFFFSTVLSTLSGYPWCRKNSCHTEELNLHQWHASAMLYQLSYIPALKSFFFLFSGWGLFTEKQSVFSIPSMYAMISQPANRMEKRNYFTLPYDLTWVKATNIPKHA